MLQIKYVQGKDMQTLENNVNAFLASLTFETEENAQHPACVTNVDRGADSTQKHVRVLKM